MQETLSHKTALMCTLAPLSVFFSFLPKDPEWINKYLFCFGTLEPPCSAFLIQHSSAGSCGYSVSLWSQTTNIEIHRACCKNIREGLFLMVRRRGIGKDFDSVM